MSWDLGSIHQIEHLEDQFVIMWSLNILPATTFQYDARSISIFVLTRHCFKFSTTKTKQIKTTEVLSVHFLRVHQKAYSIYGLL